MVLLRRLVLLMLVVSFVPEVMAQGRDGVEDATIAGLIDVVVNNVPVLQEAIQDDAFLNNQLNNREIRVVDLNENLNGHEERTLSDVSSDSQVFQNSSLITIEVLNNSPILQNFLNNLNISVERVIAIDLLPISLGGLGAFSTSSAEDPITLYVFDARRRR